MCIRVNRQFATAPFTPGSGGVKKTMNLPNKITISRIFLTFVFLYLLYNHGILGKVLSLGIYALAVLSDYWDGWIAKKRNMVTDFGKIMDPIADKIFVLGSFIAFVQMDIVEVWMVIVIIIRELLITQLRLYALSQKMVLAAEKAGKQKTVSQMVAIFIILCFLLTKECSARFGFGVGLWEVIFDKIIFVVMLITVVLTSISGISYLWKNRRLIVIK